MKKICILGSTGSIGTQALDVVSQHSDLFEVHTITAGNNAELLIQQARQFQPDTVVIANEDKYDYVAKQMGVESYDWSYSTWDRRKLLSYTEEEADADGYIFQ